MPEGVNIEGPVQSNGTAQFENGSPTTRVNRTPQQIEIARNYWEQKKATTTDPEELRTYNLLQEKGTPPIAGRAEINLAYINWVNKVGVTRIALEDRLELSDFHKAMWAEYAPEGGKPAHVRGAPSPRRNVVLEKRKQFELQWKRTHRLNEEQTEKALILSKKNGRNAANGELTKKVVSEIMSYSSLFDVRNEIKSLLGREIELNGKTGRIGELIKVMWSSPKEEIPKGMAGGGVFFPGTGEIHIYSPEPGEEDVLESLARRGEMPSGVQTLYHEWTHALQFNLFPGQKDSELIEAQAYRVDGLDRLRDSQHLFMDIAGSSFYPNISERKFAAALWLIDRFNAAGMSQLQIMECIAQAGRWNEAMGSWPSLDDRLATKMKDKKMRFEDMEAAVVLNRLQRSITYYQARYMTERILDFEFQKDLKRTFKNPVKGYLKVVNNFFRPKVEGER